jgi:hypothetical protein
VLPSGAASWVARATWHEGGRRRQSKRTFPTKKQALAALTELIAAHQSGTFVAPSRTTLSELVGPWLDGLANQDRKQTTLQGYRRVMARDVLRVLCSVALLRAATVLANVDALIIEDLSEAQDDEPPQRHRAEPRDETVAGPRRHRPRRL